MSKLQRKSTMKKGPLTKYNPAQNHWMTILPYQVQYTNTIDFPISFYFQKNYQILGSISKTFDASTPRGKHQIKNVSNVVTFRLFAMNNLTYRWSIYRKHESGQEQFVESSSVDFKTVIQEENAEKVQVPVEMARRSSFKNVQPAPPTPVAVGIMSKDMTLQFKATGINIKCMFYVSDQKQSIDSAVDKFIKQVSFKEQAGQEVSMQQILGTSDVNIPIESTEKTVEAPPAVSAQEIIAPSEENKPVEAQETPAQEVKVSETPKIEEIPVQTKEQVKKAEEKPQQIAKKEEEKPKEEQKKEVIIKEEAIKVTQKPKQEASVVEPLAGSVYTPDHNPEQIPEEVPKNEEIPVESQLPPAPAPIKSSKIGIKTIIAFLILLAAGIFGALYFTRPTVEQKKQQKKKKPKAKGKGKKK